MGSNVTRWLHNFFNIWPSARTKIAIIAKKLGKLGSKFCQILTNPQKIAQDF